QRDGTNSRIGGCPGDKQSASSFPGDVAGTMDKLAGLYHDKLCVAGPLVRETDHLIALGKTLHSLADSGNDTCQITALPGGKCGRPALVKQTFTDGCLTWINTSCPDIDKYLPWTWCRSLHIYDLQHIGPTILIKLDCFRHYLTPFSDLNRDT